MGEKLKFQANARDAFTSELTRAGWLGGSVEAACMVRQGHSPSLAATMVGVGVLKLFKSKGAKDLPRTFVLAVGGDRVVAFDGGGHSRGEGASETYHVNIDSEERGSWPRDQVRMTSAKKGINANAILHLPGSDVEVTVPDGEAEEAFEDLVAALGGAGPEPPGQYTRP
jgi:hypothetical protein